MWLVEPLAVGKGGMRPGTARALCAGSRGAAPARCCCVGVRGREEAAGLPARPPPRAPCLRAPAGRVMWGYGSALLNPLQKSAVGCLTGFYFSPLLRSRPGVL